MNRIDPELLLAELDPGRRDPGYWLRFQERVLNAVASEMAARRRAVLTLGDVVLSWGRMVVPMAVAVVAFAALLFLQRDSEEELPSVVGLEEVLSVPSDGEVRLPEFLYSDQVVDRDDVLFAVEGQRVFRTGR